MLEVRVMVASPRPLLHVGSLQCRQFNHRDAKTAEEESVARCGGSDSELAVGCREPRDDRLRGDVIIKVRAATGTVRAVVLLECARYRASKRPAGMELLSSTKSQVASCRRALSMRGSPFTRIVSRIMRMESQRPRYSYADGAEGLVL